MPRRGFKKGDSVRVKEGVACPDREGLCIAGWQGRVVDLDETEEGEPLIGIAWDSLTLKAIPIEYVEESEREGFDWGETYLSPQELKPATPRDSESEAKHLRDTLEGTYYWLGSGEQGRRIFDVIAGVAPDDEWDLLMAWGGHLRKVLTFPFAARVSEYYERGPLRQGNRVQIQGITLLDRELGIIVDVKRGGDLYPFPLCDLTVVGKKSPNYLPVKDYCIWFANR